MRGGARLVVFCAACALAYGAGVLIGAVRWPLEALGLLERGDE